MPLYNNLISADNFALAIKRAERGKKNKRAIAGFLENAGENLEKLRQSVIRGEFRTSAYRTMEITDPKRRTIYILPFCPDRIVHHALINVIGPLWENLFIRDSYACITGRGLHVASRRAMDFARRNRYVLKCDIRKFYPSINHDILFEMVRGTIADEGILEILHDIIYSIGGGKNLPIGNLCSQWMGNLYLHRMDLFIKTRLGVADYLRYSDDFCLFSNDRAQLRRWRDALREFLAETLKLEFSKCEIMPVSDGFDFVGYRHFRDFLLLRKRTMKGLRRRMLKIGAMGEIPPERAEKIRGQVASAHGWMKFACSYNLRKKLRFEQLKKKVGIKK